MDITELMKNYEVTIYTKGSNAPADYKSLLKIFNLFRECNYIYELEIETTIEEALMFLNILQSNKDKAKISVAPYFINAKMPDCVVFAKCEQSTTIIGMIRR